MAEINKLILQLQVGTVLQKCEAAEELGKLGGQAVFATDALINALDDLGEEEVRKYFDGGGGMVTYYYVRESVVNALAKVNPSAAAPVAIRVMAELKEKLKGGGSAVICTWEDKICFSCETIEAFGVAAVQQFLVPYGRPKIYIEPYDFSKHTSAERMDIVRKWLRSFFKNERCFSDYPVRVHRSWCMGEPFCKIDWMAQFLNWPEPKGVGGSPESAMLNLKAKFEEIRTFRAKTGEALPRPGASDIRRRNKLTASVEELVCQLRAGILLHKCEAAEELGRLGPQAILATDALVAALSDPDEYSGSLREDGSLFEAYIVRESAVKALAHVNPAAAAPLAIRVMAELNGKKKGRWSGQRSFEWNISFSPEEIAAFGPEAIEALGS